MEKAVDENIMLPGENGERWLKKPNVPFDDHTGPFYYRLQENGLPICAMRCESKNLNMFGTIHGGVLLTFADYAMFVIAMSALNDTPAVTLTLNSEFVGHVALGSIVECTGDVVRNTGSLVFVRGLLSSEAQVVMNFSGVIKKIRPKT